MKTTAQKHKWIAPTDAEYAAAKAEFGGSTIAFFRKCAHCGCFRRINAIRHSRLYIPKGGKWSNATATPPRCIESEDDDS